MKDDHPIPVTAVWLVGGENSLTVRLEVGGEWVDVIEEYVPTHGNDGHVWPISHIVEPAGIRAALTGEGTG